MNLKSYFKLVVKKTMGPYLPRFRSFQKSIKELETSIPSFMRENFFNNKPRRRLLILSSGLYDGRTEAIYAKALEALGYESYILANYAPFIKRIFKVYGIKKIYFYDDYFKNYPLKRYYQEAREILRNKNEEEILRFTKNNIHLGGFAASSFLRATRSSNFSLGTNAEKIFFSHLVSSLAAAQVAQDVIEDIKPDLVFMGDRGYTPSGQIFDACLSKNIPVITRNSSHKSGSEVLKRYENLGMGIIHYHSLSEESWQYVKNMPWSKDLWNRLYQDIAKTYEGGDWFSEVGTQFNKKFYSKDDIFSLLGLDSSKKTAAVFPHIFWDGTFFWGKNLFKDYYEWFVNVLKVAKENKNINWIIKIHPANLTKDKRDNYRGENLEIKAIKETLGNLPHHIKIISPQSEISSFSLYQAIDYCLTVRGTPGIETAIFGVNTLTAGTGRYDRLGFTYDFDSQGDYLDCLRHLEKMPPMTPEMIELARRFAFGVFILRPIHLDILDYGYLQDEKASIKFQPLFKTREEFEDSTFVRSLREFVISKKEDYMRLSPQL